MTPSEPLDLPRKTVAVASGTAGYTEAGEGPCLVTVPGVPGWPRDYRWLAPLLTPHFRLICLETPGFGETHRRVAPGSVRGLGDHLLRMLDALEIDRAVLISHSFGSTFATHAAAYGKRRIAGLALLSPVGLTPHRGLKRLPSPGLLTVAVGVPVLGRGLAAGLAAGLRAAGLPKTLGPRDAARIFEIVAGFSFAQHAANVARLRAPTFVAWSADDPLVEPERVTDLLPHLPGGPRLYFEEGGHNLQKSRAVEIAEALVPWARERFQD